MRRAAEFLIFWLSTKVDFGSRIHPFFDWGTRGGSANTEVRRVRVCKKSASLHICQIGESVKNSLGSSPHALRGTTAIFDLVEPQ